MFPNKIGRYEIKAELGRGGMATVYRAYDPRFKRDVALKVLPREFLHDPHFRARFDREAEIIAALEHSAIVPVYDFGEDADARQPFIVMRLMTGGSLAERLERGPLALAETARIFSRLAPALDRAHAKGIVHRDLKPGNILFDDEDNPFISDFGIAKISEASTVFTGTGGIVGTPAYMSPEQARGDKNVDSRSDIYALGAIIYQMLTGQLPYEADTPMGLAFKHITEPVPHILESKPDLPISCDQLIRRAMAKNRDERYSTASHVAEALTTIVSGKPIPGMPAPGPAGTDLQGLFSKATRLQIAGQLGEALETYRYIKAVSPTHPRIDIAIRAVEAEMQKGYVDRFGRVDPTQVAAGPVTASAPASAAKPKGTNWLAFAGSGLALICGFVIVASAGLTFLSSNLGSPPAATSVLALAEATLSATLVPTSPPVLTTLMPTTDGQIAFVTDRDGNQEIYLSEADGSNPINLTHNPATDRDPAWSPDGSQIAFHTDRDGNLDIYVMNADGTGLTRLAADPADDGSPDWSPDGARIAFTSTRDGDDSEIYVMNADGSNVIRLTDNEVDDSAPDWSPDGQRIVFDRTIGEGEEIFVMSADGANQTQLTFDSGASSPDWSPDGTRIAFYAFREQANADIYIMNSDGSNTVRLTTDPRYEANPIWSPDGERIAYFVELVSDKKESREVFIMNADGSAQTQITNNTARDELAVWRAPSSATATAAATFTPEP